MKKTIWTAGILVTGLLMGTSGAQGKAPARGAGDASLGMGMGKHMGMHKTMMSDSCPMGGMLMHGMMGRTVVPTQDGGVVVMIGNQLYKYDKNLALKKEAEIKLDTAKLRAAMRSAMQACPLMETSRDTSAVAPGNPTGRVAPAADPSQAQAAAPAKTAKQPKQDDNKSNR